MSRGIIRTFLKSLPLTAVCLWASTSVLAQYGTKNGEWTAYGGESGSTRYAPLDQINKDNFNKLEIAWRFRTDKLGARPDFNFQATPLMVNGVIYSTAV